MKCDKCGKNGATKVKHIHYGNGWITLSEQTKLCLDCVEKQRDDFQKAFDEIRKAVQKKYENESTQK